MNRKLDVSVVICAYTEDRWDDLVAAVESVKKQIAPAREIIVVVDHNPRLKQRVQAHLPDVFVVENKESPGASGAKNRGIAAAQGAVIAFLDDDAMAQPDWLAQLSADYENPLVIGVGGAIEPVWSDSRPRWFPEEFDWVVGCTYRGMPQATSAVRNLIGCNMSFRQEVFAEVHGFYTGIGHKGPRPVGGSDPEFCIRVRQMWPHKLILYEPQAKVCHKAPRSRASWRYFYWRCYLEGRSKALLSRLFGAGDSLSTERTYVYRILPRGVIQGLADTAIHGDPYGLSRAGAILTGLAITTTGYLVGLVSERLEHLANLSRKFNLN